MDFHEIEQWLTETAPHAGALSVRVYFEELARFIRRHINGGLDMSETEEIEALLKDKANLESAVAIASAWPDVRKRMLTSLKGQLVELWKEEQQDSADGKLLGFEETMIKGSAECWFGFTRTSGQVFLLSFAFERSGLRGLYWGVSTLEGNIPKEHQAASSRIAELMRGEFGFDGQTNQWWAWWAYADRDPITEEFKDWQSSAEPWVQIQSGELARKIVQIVNLAYQTLSDQPNLLKGLER